MARPRVSEAEGRRSVMAEDHEPIIDFRVISEGTAPHTPPEVGDVWTEEVGVARGWVKGTPIGTVTITASGQANKPEFQADFTFDTYDPVTVTGLAPGGKRWRGRGNANARKSRAEGAEAAPEEEIAIDFVNPKKWG
jgi:hypothetical protein